MRFKTYLLALAITANIFAIGCSSPVERSVSTGQPSTNSANIAPRQDNPAGTAPVSAVSPTPADEYVTSSGKKIVDEPAAGPPPPLIYKAAGEDSEIATTMTKDGAMMEIRVFKKHPQLAKVEATWLGARQKSLKYLLKNGKVLEVKTERLTNLQNATTGLLLEIAGLKAPARDGDTSAAGDKKSPAQ